MDQYPNATPDWDQDVRGPGVAPGTVLVLMGSPDDTRAVCDAVKGKGVALPLKT